MNELFDGLSQMQQHAVPFVLTQRLRARFPGKHVLATRDHNFRVDPWARAGKGTRKAQADAVVLDPVGGHRDEFWMHRYTGWEQVDFDGKAFEVVTVTLPDRYGSGDEWHWVVGATESAANAFFLSVAEWNRQVHGEILVFEAGCFCKSKELQDDIAHFKMDDLVLAGGLGQALSADLKRFLAAKAHYARAKAPWKRGLLFLGPPGNGKTHAVKSLLRESGLPCIYVKSFSGKRIDPHDTIPKVFDRARDLAPVVLVLEDLDAQIDDSNRSLLLNELDGFAKNEGIVTIATTNHPERLDPSLLHRPSRFDRKFHFPLPESAERTRYLTRWGESLDAPMRPSPEGVLRASDGAKGFTFAYLKEATLSALVDFASDDARPSMDDVLVRVVEGLAKEIAALPEGGSPPPMPKPRKLSFDDFEF